MRLFVAFDIDAEIRRRIAEFRDRMRSLAPEVRWVAPETFHVTLQFLGETRKLDEIQRALRQVKAVSATLSFRTAGFFPTPRSPRVFWIGIEADEHLQELAKAIAEATQPLGFERDAAPYKPHLTLARAGSGRPSSGAGGKPVPGLQRVRAQLETIAPPEFGTMRLREFYLYESKLSPAGAQYTKLARYPLDASHA